MSDPETVFLYLMARYYDPNTAQFLTPDPMFAVTGERYGYAGNNPLNASDPTGLSCNPADVFMFSIKDCANDVGRAEQSVSSYASSWVPDCFSTGVSNCTSLGDIHPIARDTLYVTAGEAATVASGGLTLDALGVIDLGTGTSALVFEGGFSTGFGVIAAHGDYGRCRHGGDKLACLGMYTGGFGALLGFPALIPEFGAFGIPGVFLGAGALAIDGYSLGKELVGGCP